MDRSTFETLFPKTEGQTRAATIQAFLKSNRSTRSYSYLSSFFDKHPAHAPRKKIALLASCNLDLIRDMLQVEAEAAGVPCDLFIGGYGQAAALITDSTSELYKYCPDILMIMLRLEDIFPKFYSNFLSLGEKRLAAESSNMIGALAQQLTTFRKHSSANILLSNFGDPLFLAAGFSDAQNPNGQLAMLNNINHELSKMAVQRPGLHIFNLHYHQSRFGLEKAYDAKMDALARCPYSNAFLAKLAEAYGQAIRTIIYGPKKCLVMDLDNTLWGGIIGEDGLKGIQLSHDYPGNLYRQIQMLVKQFSARGIILALNSKNNQEDAQAVFEQHPDMVLKWEDFAAIRVNWLPKDENLKSIAKELNIGTDSLVFVDDNPAEIELIRRRMPEVQTIQFGTDALENWKTLRDLSAFESSGLSNDDLERGKRYAAQVQRRALQQTATSLEDYYRGLDMVVQIRSCDPLSVARVAQLTQKTNQFNLTTKRYSESEIEAMIRSYDWRVFYLRLADKFGDNGIVGVALIEVTAGRWRLDTFLMSCRVIGRTVETAFLSFLQNEARQEQAHTLVGFYKPTQKNAIVKNLYPEHGFRAENKQWLKAVNDRIEPPPWIEVI